MFLQTLIVAVVVTAGTALLFKYKNRSQLVELESINNPNHPWKNRRICILVNPFGGSRTSLHKLAAFEPVLRKLDIGYNVVKTTSATFAYDYCKSLKSDHGYAGMMIISGDGMIHQCINGLRDNPSQISLALFFVPGGTMNGLSTSLGQPFLKSALNNFINCSSIKTLDAYEIKHKNGTMLDVHAFSTCIVADHDELLERTFRSWPLFLRLILAPMIVIAQCKSYKAKLFMKIAKINPDLDKHIKTSKNLEIDKNRKGWYVIDDEFVFLTVMNTSHGSYDTMFVPSARPDDNAVYVMLIRKGVSRLQLLKTFLSLETGSHANFPFVEIYKVSELEYRPFTKQGYMSASGEDVPVGDVDIKVLPNYQKVLY